MNLNDIGSVWRWILLLDFMNQPLFLSYITLVHYWDLKNAHLHALGSQITFQSVLNRIFFLLPKEPFVQWKGFMDVKGGTDHHALCNRLDCYGFLRKVC